MSTLSYPVELETHWLQVAQAETRATTIRDVLHRMRPDIVRLEAAAIPLSRAARKTKQPLHHALCDGEDFELLFTVSPKNRARFAADWQRAFPKLPAVCIGEILADPKRRCLHFPGSPAVPLQAGGYQHFLAHRSR